MPVPELTAQTLQSGDQLAYYLFVTGLAGMVAVIGMLGTIAWIFGKQAVKNFTESIERRFAVGDETMKGHGEAIAEVKKNQELFQRDWEYCCGERRHHRDHENEIYPHKRATDPAGG